MGLHAHYLLAQKLVVILEYDALDKPDGQLSRYKLHLLQRLVIYLNPNSQVASLGRSCDPWSVTCRASMIRFIC
jgi:hypothetical protein